MDIAAELAKALCDAIIRDLAGPNRSVPTLTQEARDILESYAWPDNVRELRAVVERAVQASRDGWIGADQLRRLGERLDELSLPRPRTWVR